MFQADIHGKTGVPEDALTSCFFHLLKLLPDNCLIEILALARNLDGQGFSLIGFEKVNKVENRPWLCNGGCSDIAVTLEPTPSLRPQKIIVEVKHGSGKSGGKDDQLARYFQAAVDQYPDFEVSLIYLTHHRDMPALDLKDSISQLSNNAPIFWLSWYAISSWAAYKKREQNLPTANFRILSALYLTIREIHDEPH